MPPEPIAQSRSHVSFHPNDMRRRSIGAMVMIAGMLLFLTGAFFRSQVVQHHKYALQAETNRLREIPLGKTALDREMRTVRVGGQDVRVKLALHNGVVVNVQPEYDDVARAAERTGRPVKEVLADAVAASRRFRASTD